MSSGRTTAVLDRNLTAIIGEIRAPACWHDPYRYYRNLREHAPILRTADRKIVVTGHAECRGVLSDARWEHFPELLCMSSRVFSNDPSGGERPPPARPGVTEALPDRARLRGRLASEFTPRAMHSMRDGIQKTADALFDEITEASSVDLIDALIIPFTASVLAEAFGVPPVDRTLFRKWSATLRRAAEAGFVPAGPRPQKEAETSAEVSEYMKALVAERRRSPSDDLLSALLSGLGGDQKWSEDEIIATLVSIVIVGHHTTTASIGNGTLALLGHPKEFARLRATPEAAVPAVEELLRYDAPAQFVSRYATEELDLGEDRVVPGDIALLFLGAANRDPAAFADPDGLDITRARNDHLAFSHGHAYCFGAPLARLAGQLFFTALGRRLPGLAVDGDPVFFDTIGLRGLAALPVRTG
jgi:cytochrome P450